MTDQYEDFFEAVAKDPGMTDEQKMHWINTGCAEPEEPKRKEFDDLLCLMGTPYQKAMTRFEILRMYDVLTDERDAAKSELLSLREKCDKIRAELNKADGAGFELTQEVEKLRARIVDLETENYRLLAAKTNLSKGRNIIVIEILGETILQSELDDLAETWVHFGMPRGKYVLHPAEIEQLTNDVRFVISRFDKEGEQ